MRTWTTATPPGAFTVLAEDGVVRASGWTDDPEELLALVAPALHSGPLEEASDLGPISDAVTRYLEGDLDAVRGVEVEQRSGPFLEHAWETLRDVPPGAPVTYAELAARAGRPAAVRAAGSACARNAAALFVPCHRVLRTDGALGGFRWGLAVKDWLLTHERTP